MNWRFSFDWKFSNILYLVKLCLISQVGILLLWRVLNALRLIHYAWRKWKTGHLYIDKSGIRVNFLLLQVILSISWNMLAIKNIKKWTHLLVPDINGMRDNVPVSALYQGYSLCRLLFWLTFPDVGNVFLWTS